ATTPGWKRGFVDVTYSASDNVGIKSVGAQEVGIGLDSRPSVCSYTRAAPCPNGTGRLNIDTRRLPAGRRSLLVTATDAAGNTSNRAVAVNVDNDPPGPPLDLSVAGGSMW